MSLIYRLKPFCIWHHIRRNNRFESRQNRFQRCHWPSWNRKWGLGNPQLISASSTCIVWGYLSLEYFCWIFPLTEEQGLVKSVWDFSGVTLISAVSMTPLKFEYNRFSRRIRSHMRNGFRAWIRALGGIVWWKKPRVKNLVLLSL
jgi:hypothetical protein